MAWVYLLRCADGTTYVGSTVDLDARLAQHAAGGCVYTSTRLPVEVIWCQEFERKDEAWEMERRIHGWSGGKRLALAEGRFGDLRTLSRSHDHLRDPDS
ncbi:GIY-YIG nuclease family protein [Propionibacteriaceae bacterium Y1700]|uniref:GIY-YIG nuclease family protein n=1 Tax=Microlunatus sp. Y1700 TaxID=3418487 RepID=UPI003DA6CE80